MSSSILKFILFTLFLLSSGFLVDFTQGLTHGNRTEKEDRHRHGHNKRSASDISDEGSTTDQHHQKKLAYSLPLDPDSNYQLSWTPDFQKEEIQFRVDISQSMPQSWFALGFSDRGDWAGADLCVGWEDWKGSFIVQVNLFRLHKM